MDECPVLSAFVEFNAVTLKNFTGQNKNKQEFSFLLSNVNVIAR